MHKPWKMISAEFSFSPITSSIMSDDLCFRLSTPFCLLAHIRDISTMTLQQNIKQVMSSL